MVCCDGRRMQMEGTGLQLTLRHLLLQELKHKLILVELIRPHIYHKMQQVGNHIMLGTALHDRHCHLRCSQQLTLLSEPVVAQPHQVVQRLIDGVHALFPGRMATHPMGIAVNHHQASLCRSRLHAGRFSHDGHVDGWHQGQHTSQAILA